PSNIRLLIIGTGLFAIQQLSGINFVLLTISSPALHYARPHFLPDLLPGVPFVILVGFVNLLSTILFILVVDRVGRRPLLIGGMVGLVAALVLLIGQFTPLPFVSLPSASMPMLLIAY